MSVVKFRIEKALGMPVVRVNVHVQGLRVSAETQEHGEAGGLTLE
jgi:uncharacterized alkaline shock family protein YloU